MVHSAWRILFLLLLTISATGAASARDSENSRCLDCHAGKTMLQKNGKRLHIDPVMYAATTHSYVGCKTCHQSITAGHPGDSAQISKPSKATCRECHASTHAEYAKSRHSPMAACNDCHNPHEVKPPLSVSGKDMNAKCAKCHNIAAIVKTHGKWLQQADLHIDSLPCITCHTGSKNYVITLTIEIRKPEDAQGNFKLATHEELSRIVPKGNDIAGLIDINNDKSVSLNELRDFNNQMRRKQMRLWGMMTPEAVSHSYDILDNRRDCTFCHVSGPKAIQTSYVAIPDKSGGYTRLPVEKGAILDILNGTPDFYMLGVTRSKTLDIIGAVIIAAGLAMPLGHGLLRFLTRKNRRKRP